MNFNHEIQRYGIPHCCMECIHRESCQSKSKNIDNPHCGKFIPDNIDNFLNRMINYMSMYIPKSSNKYLKRINVKQRVSSDNITPLDSYYVDFINDSIKQLRDGKTAYVFKLYHIKDIIPFVPDFTVRYNDGIFELKIKK